MEFAKIKLLCLMVMAGFLLAGLGADRTACGSSFNTSTGEIDYIWPDIRYDDFNYGYPNNADCRWTITALPGKSVQYFFTEFNIETGNCYDSIRIYDGINSSAPLIGKFCHTTDVTKTWKSCGTSIHFQFLSDYSNFYGVCTGFHIVWNETTLDCVNPPPTPSNGVLYPNTGVNNGCKVSLTCNPGHTLNGSSEVTCGSGGIYNAAFGECLPDCEAPTPPSNGVVSPATTAAQGTKTNITCNTGFTIKGIGELTCEPGGIWSTGGVCLEDCPAPTQLNGAVSPAGSAPQGLTATITCGTGYTLLNGGAEITCGAGGIWSTGGECLKDCPAPTTLNGAVSPAGSAPQGSTATITCGTDYTLLNGGAEITCQAGGIWSAGGACLKDCPAPTQPNGAVSPAGSAPQGSTATITCGTGYTLLNGGAEITCQAGGIWSAGGACLKDCPAPTQLNGAVSPASSAPQGSTATITCGTDYTLLNGGAEITCQAGGIWSTGGACLKDCPAPDQLNGAVSPAGSAPQGSTATITCGTDYTLLNGGAEITCQAWGIWSTGGACLKDCPAPTTLNGAVSPAGSAPQGSTATITCGTDYTLLNGGAEITCQAGGIWSARGACLKDCPAPTTLNGAVSPAGSAPQGSTATITCGTGYTLLNGGDEITCQAGGLWSAGGECLKDCPAPTQPNGTVSPTGSAPQGATANITCNQGYTLLNGGAEIACEAGGIWSAGGECLKGMTATNPLECGTNGEWSGEVRKCVRECVIKKLTNTDKDTNEVIKCIKNACLWKDGKGKQLQLMKQINGETIQKPKKVKGIGWKRQYLKPSYPEEGLTQWNKFKKLKKLLKT